MHAGGVGQPVDAVLPLGLGVGCQREGAGSGLRARATAETPSGQVATAGRSRRGRRDAARRRRPARRGSRRRRHVQVDRWAPPRPPVPRATADAASVPRAASVAPGRQMTRRSSPAANVSEGLGQTGVGGQRRAAPPAVARAPARSKRLPATTTRPGPSQVSRARAKPDARPGRGRVACGPRPRLATTTARRPTPTGTVRTSGRGGSGRGHAGGGLGGAFGHVLPSCQPRAVSLGRFGPACPAGTRVERPTTRRVGWQGCLDRLGPGRVTHVAATTVDPEGASPTMRTTRSGPPSTTSTSRNACSRPPRASRPGGGGRRAPSIERAAADVEGFWAEQAGALDWFDAVAHGARMGPALRQVVRRGDPQRVGQLPRPPRRRRAGDRVAYPLRRASRATPGRSPTPSCSPTSSGSPTCSRASGCDAATGWPSTCP